jgi:hypothetical protein
MKAQQGAEKNPKNVRASKALGHFAKADIRYGNRGSSKRDAATLERIIWWNAGPPGYRWPSIAIPPGQANANLHSRMPWRA